MFKLLKCLNCLWRALLRARGLPAELHGLLVVELHLLLASGTDSGGGDDSGGGTPTPTSDGGDGGSAPAAVSTSSGRQFPTLSWATKNNKIQWPKYSPVFSLESTEKNDEAIAETIRSARTQISSLERVAMTFAIAREELIQKINLPIAQVDML